METLPRSPQGLRLALGSALALVLGLSGPAAGLASPPAVSAKSPALSALAIPNSPTLSGGTSSPTLGRTTGILLAGGLAGLLSWQNEDPDQVVSFLDGSVLETPIDVGDVYASGLVVGGGALGSLALGHLIGQPGMKSFGADLTRSFLVSSAVVWTLKLSLNRTRPNGASYSFPSGHTATAFCAAPVLAKHFGWKAGIPAYALAVSAGLGRMEDRKHFMSDVFLGAAIGLAVGDAVIRPGFGEGLLDRIAVGRNGVGLRVQF